MKLGSPEPRGSIGWRWRKPVRSGGDTNCVEIGQGHGLVGIRDTKDRDGGTLLVDRAMFAAFLADAKAGRFS
ncbi:DUF397 domain-containing protein [Actinoalloteichus hymeniacidonis]|uniref:DUF397 family protein n=1 Tax=Actinoalloteichus hymeniacidonis TaxID=340345 RepID=A0AAC9N0P6_9PSEU|nr:DUF397 domain-containing protein [Actinoalloteichus hymeniacidonis]AOS65625.1 putative DUF397 family protein [Actinoalloteichus hymeniacidonis]MBB5906284.1 hypothetical protein [Actinoalloteichus hymeniacidonis]